MKRILVLITLPILAACTTPTTTLKHKKTGQIVTCGGSSGASWAGGAIGYEIQKDHDSNCVNNYKSEGFRVVKTTNN